MYEIYERPPVFLNDSVESSTIVLRTCIFTVDSAGTVSFVFYGRIECWFKWIRYVTIALRCPQVPNPSTASTATPAALEGSHLCFDATRGSAKEGLTSPR